VPFLADQFAAVKLDGSDFVLGTRPAFQFMALAQARCKVCEESVMRPQNPIYRYPEVHSCIKCEELCCAACSCQCTCLSACGVDGDEDMDRNVEECTSCRGWYHSSCAEFGKTIFFCGLCVLSKPARVYCEHCWKWFLLFCPECADVRCNECGEMSWCHECNENYCDECRDVAFCQSCSSSFCFTCRVVAYCETCEMSYCDSCGH
jgi:hypothetical protein